MWKLFCKTLLVSVLSGSLLMLNFNFNGSMLNVNMNSVQAETVKTDGIKDGDMMATLTMAGVGLLTQRLWTCKLSTDMLIAAAAGAAFIAGEILSTLKLKKVMKDMEMEIKRDDKGVIDQKQIEVLEKLRESYVKAKETANNKKMLQQAAAAAFAAAGVVAVMLAATEEAALNACQTALVTANSCVGLTAATAPSTAVLTQYRATRIIPKISVAGAAASTASQATALASFTTVGTTAGTLGGSYAATCPESPSCALAPACFAQVSPVPAICSPVMPMLKLNEGYCPAGLSLGSTENKLNKYYYAASPIHPRLNIINFMRNLLMGDAKADLFTPLGIASSAATTFLMAAVPAIGMAIDTFLLAPMNRAIAWGGLGGLTLAASAATDNQIQKIEGNIAKIDLILNSMYALADGVKQENNMSVKNPKIETTIVQNQNVVFNELKTQEIDLKAMGGGPLPCITGSDPVKCPSFSEKLNNQPEIKILPSFVQTQIGNISTLADGLNGHSKISGTTLDKAKLLAGQANALRKVEAEKRKQLQAALKARGIKRDLAKDAAKFDAMMKAAVQKELDKSHMTAAQMLASFGGGAGSVSSAPSSKVVADENQNSKTKDQKAKEDANASATTESVAKTATGDKSKSGKDDDELAAEGLEGGSSRLDDSNVVYMDTRNVKASNGDALPPIDDYDAKIGVNQEDNVSLFEVISKRYKKSGYPRLFKRVK